MYIRKSLGKQDHYDLGGYCMACHIRNLLEFKKNLLEMGYAAFIETMVWS